MKEIKAFIRTNMVDQVIDALENLPITPGITVSEVQGWGHSKNGTGAKLTERIKLETVVPDDQVETVLDCLVKYARTGEGHYGDGVIFVSPVNEVIRIRNGQRGKEVVEHKD
ncbi:P-II family nitrogen regulator [Prolixibacter sp. SD074]|uniref:P-II family nitrogen regulator n=1 Tax=Prolixibacter sp. SD074 TaxID=2652391 RepID=UPI0012819B21|nr:P-II family nitrogen regulator [Prolixibacter sp. SD074]GET29171.1 nitrogen regulatory protein P-II 1 [Prolixibacter sp. SD074]